MVYALRQPAVLLGMVLGFVAAGVLRAGIVGLVAGGTRGARVGLRRWQAWFDPFGLVAVIISGIGWLGAADRARPRRSLVIDVVAHGVIAAAAFAGLVSVEGGRSVLGFVSLGGVLHGGVAFGQRTAALCAGAAMINLGCGLLALVPIPPLAAGVWAWSTMPRTPGARRVAYHLIDEHWGVAAVLVLLLIPLGTFSPLLNLVDTVGDALLRLVA